MHQSCVTLITFSFYWLLPGNGDLSMKHLGGGGLKFMYNIKFRFVYMLVY